MFLIGFSNCVCMQYLGLILVMGRPKFRSATLARGVVYSTMVYLIVFAYLIL